MNKTWFEQIFDLTAAFIGLVVLSPILIVIGLVILFDSGWPIFFRQERVGQGGRLFKIYKFRTMKITGRRFQFTPPWDKGITPAGKILRKYKLDEIPQLLNVLKGEMSLVGLRPEVPQFAKYYLSEYKHLLDFKPGITDCASLKFIEESVGLEQRGIDYDDYYRRVIVPEKLKYSQEYLLQKNFFSDLRIILKTILAVLLRR